MKTAKPSAARCVTRSLVPSSWSRALQRRGFVAVDAGYRRNGILVKSVDRWVVLETSVSGSRRGRTLASLDGCGLWKRVGSERKQRFVFELPAEAGEADVEDHAPDEDASLSPESFLDWALACLMNEVPQAWQAPSSEVVASWMPPGALTLRVGPLLRQGKLVLTPNRWTVSFPILPLVPADLSAERRRCLETLAGDAQDRWHMIRVAPARSDEGDSLVAKIDLTGAPRSELLFLAGLDGLRHAVLALAETADLLADVTVTLQALEVCPPQTEKTERKQR